MKKKNILVQYQGGGYEGCYWEYNFFFVDNEGKFHNIISTGDKGIITQEQAEEIIKNEANSTGTYIYNVLNKRKMREFEKENATFWVYQVAIWLEEHFPELELRWTCARCRKKCWIEEMDIDEDKLICCECIAINSCGYCGQYYEDNTDLIFNITQVQKIYDMSEKLAQRVLDHYGPICVHCLEDLLKVEIKNEIEHWNRVMKKI